MKVAYDEEVDVLTITLSNAPIVDSDEVQPGIIFDYDKAGNTVGIELLDASRRVDNPYSLSYDYARLNTNEHPGRDTSEAASATLSPV